MLDREWQTDGPASPLCSRTRPRGLPNTFQQGSIASLSHTSKVGCFTPPYSSEAGQGISFGWSAGFTPVRCRTLMVSIWLYMSPCPTSQPWGGRQTATQPWQLVPDTTTMRCCKKHGVFGTYPFGDNMVSSSGLM